MNDKNIYILARNDFYMICMNNNTVIKWRVGWYFDDNLFLRSNKKNVTIGLANGFRLTRCLAIIWIESMTT